jgi:hypothetical protein
MYTHNISSMIITKEGREQEKKPMIRNNQLAAT